MKTKKNPISLPEKLKPSDHLKKLAREEAKALGHTLGHFSKEASPNGTFFTRCTKCDRSVSVIPAAFAKDGKGRGGKALSEQCPNANDRPCGECGLPYPCDHDAAALRLSE